MSDYLTDLAISEAKEQSRIVPHALYAGWHDIRGDHPGYWRRAWFWRHTLPKTANLVLFKIGQAIAAIVPCVVAILLFSSCALLSPGPEGVDLAQLADEIALYRQDVQDLAPVASPETKAKIAQIAAAIVEVELALRAAAAETGPVSDAIEAARAALVLADALIPTTPEGSDLRLYLGVARIVLRHVAAGQM